jgi:multidrug transporter EmrE-like cation transporter
MERPAGIASIAGIFFLAAAYLLVLGIVMLASPGTLSMSLGAPLLGGLELAGPYMFLLVGGLAAVIAWGLFRLNKWAGRAAILAAVAGLVILIPTVSAAAVDFRWPLLWSGLGVIVRVMIAWYLFQEPVKAVFEEK